MTKSSDRKREREIDKSKSHADKFVDDGHMTLIVDEKVTKLNKGKPKRKRKGPKPKEKFNPYHVPAGVPEGGQFTTTPEGTSTGFDQWKSMNRGQMHSVLLGQNRITNEQLDAVESYIENGFIPINATARGDTDALEDYVAEVIVGVDKGFLDTYDEDFESAAGMTFAEFDSIVEDVKAEAESNIELLDAAMDGAVINQDIVSYRGLDLNHFADVDEFQDSNELVNTLNIQFPVSEGATISDDGFLSTSIRQGVAFEFVDEVNAAGRIGGLLEVRIPEGSNALYVDGQRRIWENEVLLPRETVLTVVDVKLTSGVPTIVVEAR